VELEDKLGRIIMGTDRADIIRAVGRLDLPDCWAAAGIVRNSAWDAVHEYVSTPSTTST
jgi:hypothetical protein